MQWFEQNCLGDDVSDVVPPSNAFLSYVVILSLAPYNDVGDVVSQALLLNVYASIERFSNKENENLPETRISR